MPRPSWLCRECEHQNLAGDEFCRRCGQWYWPAAPRGVHGQRPRSYQGLRTAELREIEPLTPPRLLVTPVR